MGEGSKPVVPQGTGGAHCHWSYRKKEKKNPLYSWERTRKGPEPRLLQVIMLGRVRITKTQGPKACVSMKLEQDGREAVFLTLTPTISLPSTK